MRPFPLSVILIAVLILAGCDRSPPASSFRFLAFGTLIDLTIAGVPEREARAAADAMEEDFARMHRDWHAWDPGPLGLVNSRMEDPAPFEVPPVVLPLLLRGQVLAEQSEHLFNPAIGRLIDAWGFHGDGTDERRPPPADRIGELLRADPRMSDLVVEGSRMYSRNRAVKLDFGAFGKGYGIDLAMNRLRELGIANAILNAGGDLRAIGSRNGTPWRIAVRHHSGEGILGVLETGGDESVFTSGGYERNFTWEGRRYHHIIDPRTGYPATGTASVTVIDTDATKADAAATALFVAGPEKWYAIASRMGVRHVLLVDERGNLHMDPGMRKRIKLENDGYTVTLSPPLGGAASSGEERTE